MSLLGTLLERSRMVEAELVAHVGEVDARRLYAREGSPSMFAYCTDVLHLSEHQAYERITAARAARMFPMLLEMLRDGRLHLSGISKLVPHLTEDNCADVLARAAHMTKRQVEELVAALAPKPDVPPVIRKLPERPTPPANSCRQELAVRPAAPPPAPPMARPVVAPLAPARYKVQFTASAELRDKLEYLQALLGEDLAGAIEAAVTEKIERLEAKRYGRTTKPTKTVAETDTTPSSRHVPAPIRRAVHARDGGRCTFRDANGRRCPERHRLELHHDTPYGRGGDHSVGNLRLVCKIHNAYFAEMDYGTKTMDSYRGAGKVREAGSAFGRPSQLLPAGARVASASPSFRYSAPKSVRSLNSW